MGELSEKEYDPATTDKAASCGRVREILTLGATLEPPLTPNIRELSYGASLIGMAVQHGELMLAVLLEFGADPDMADAMDGETALDKCVKAIEMIGEEELDDKAGAEAEDEASNAAAPAEEEEGEDEDEDEAEKAASRAILTELRSMEAMLIQHGASTLSPDERVAQALRQAAADAAACEPCQMNSTYVTLSGKKRGAEET